MLTLLHTLVQSSVTIDPEVMDLNLQMFMAKAHKYVVMAIVNNVLKPVFTAGPQLTDNKEEDEAQFNGMMEHLPSNEPRFIIWRTKTQIAFISWYALVTIVC